MKRVSKPYTIAALLVIILPALFIAYQVVAGLGSPHDRAFLDWWRGDATRRAELMTVQKEACPAAPFSACALRLDLQKFEGFQYPHLITIPQTQPCTEIPAWIERKG